MKWRLRLLRLELACTRGEVSQRQITGGVSTASFKMTTGNQIWYSLWNDMTIFVSLKKNFKNSEKERKKNINSFYCKNELNLN